MSARVSEQDTCADRGATSQRKARHRHKLGLNRGDGAWVNRSCGVKQAICKGPLEGTLSSEKCPEASSDQLEP